MKGGTEFRKHTIKRALGVEISYLSKKEIIEEIQDLKLLLIEMKQ